MCSPGPLPRLCWFVYLVKANVTKGSLKVIVLLRLSLSLTVTLRAQGVRFACPSSVRGVARDKTLFFFAPKRLAISGQSRRERPQLQLLPFFPFDNLCYVKNWEGWSDRYVHWTYSKTILRFRLCLPRNQAKEMLQEWPCPTFQCLVNKCVTRKQNIHRRLCDRSAPIRVCSLVCFFLIFTNDEQVLRVEHLFAKRRETIHPLIIIFFWFSDSDFFDQRVLLELSCTLCSCTHPREFSCSFLFIYTPLDPMVLDARRHDLHFWRWDQERTWEEQELV